MTNPYAAPQFPPSPAALTPADENQLTLLSTLFYVYAAFVALVGLALAGFGVLPAILISATAQAPRARADGWIVGGMFLAIFGTIALLLISKAVVMALAARAFGRRSGYVLCMIGACVALMNIPLGTALGIFAISVLQKPAVKARFA